jgi:hypothetical protein
MTTITAMANPGTGHGTMIRPEDILTEQQMRTLKRLPVGHEFVGILGRTPIVRQPDGQLSRMRTGGRLVKAGGVPAAQSYLLVQG